MAYSREFLVTFSDCDPAKIVYFANYPRFAHETIEHFTEQAGGWDLWFRSKDYGAPLVHCEAQYHKSVLCGQRVRAELELLKTGNSSVQFKTQFFVKDQLCSEVKTTHVFIDFSTKTKRPIPEEIHEVLKQLQ